MDETPVGEWTLDQMLTRLESEQARLGLRPADPRVADRPSVRTVRYYATLGILDRPLGYRAGSARYGRRHLLQYLAVKALQAEHMALPEIQRRLYGLSDSDLERVVAAAARPDAGDGPGEAPHPWLTIRSAPGLVLLVDDAVALRQWLLSTPPGEVDQALRQALHTLSGPTHPEEEPR